MIVLLLKKIYTYLIRLFARKTEKKDVWKLEDLVPDLKSVNGKELFNSIKPGDIVLAVSQGSLKELAVLDKSHRIRPYIIARKEDDRLIAYCGTSNPDKKYYRYFELSRNDYHVSKDGRINLSRPCNITEDQILCVKDHLTILDILDINEILYLANLSYTCPYISHDTGIRAGQVIWHKKELYYVYSVSGTAASVYKLLPGYKENAWLSHNGALYHPADECSELVINDEVMPTSTVSHVLKEQIIWCNANHTCTKKAKKPNEFAVNHTYTYPIGQTFTAGFRSYIYLFSSKDRDYGLEEEDLDLEAPQVRRLRDIEYFHKSDVLNDDLLFDTVERLTCYNTSFNWLYDSLCEQTAG